MIRVLLVDDENYMIEGLTNHIPWRELGVDEVLAEVDPLRALDTALSKKPDILVTDIRMPKMDGIELAKQVRERLAKCSILFLTAYNEKEYLKSAILLRAIDFLEKPVDRDELCATVRRIVSEIRAREEDAAAHLGEDLPAGLAKPLTDAEMKRLLEPFSLEESLPCAYACIKTDVPAESVLPEAARKRLNAGIEALFGAPGCLAFAAMKQTDGFAVLLAGDSVPERPFADVDVAALEKLLSLSFEKQARAFVGAGNRVPLTRAFESYALAAHCMQRAFFLGYGRTLRWDELREGRPVDPDIALAGFEKKLKSLDRRLILEYVDGVVPAIRDDTGFTTQMVKDLLFRMLVSLENLGRTLSPDLAEENLWDKAETIRSLDSFRQYLIDKINRVIPGDNGRDSTSRYVAFILRSIEENYADSGFSLEAIARSVHLSMQYICRIFKEATGETINARIAFVRVEKAKELLKDDGMRLADVACSVGYRSPNHFAKVFRELEGVNPSVYRTIHRVDR